MNKTTLIALLCFIVSFSSFSQTEEVNYHKACDQAENSNNGVNENHPYAKELAKITKALKFSKNSLTGKTTNRKYIIPVVFHVVDQNAEKVTDAQVDSAIKILNEDFTATNAEIPDIANYFKPVIGSLDIEFRLAKIDPSGNAVTGINRVFADGICRSTRGGRGEKAINCPVKVTAPAWDTDRYLNIWIINDVLGGTTNASTGSGWAFRSDVIPDIDEGEDGIVYNHRFLGTTGSSDAARFNGDIKRTLTHEVGHYLNLKHTHQDFCNTSRGGDSVDDTPPVKFDNCGTCCPEDINNPNNLYLSCDGVTPINVQNFMTYSGCPSMFTKGQATRMEASLLSSIRKNLWTEENLINTGVATKQVLSVESQNLLELKIYPNPIKNNLNIESKTALSLITIYNTIGKKIKSEKTNQLKLTLNLSGIANGIYILNITDTQGNKTTRKLIKTN